MHNKVNIIKSKSCHIIECNFTWIIYSKNLNCMHRSLIVLLLIIFVCSLASAGCTFGNCNNGNGTAAFKDGSRYSGLFRNGKFHGSGTLVFKDGSTYKGNFVNGKMSGEGRLVFVSGNEYSGSFDNNRFHGDGVMKFSNGDHYNGTWENNNMSGKGIYTFSTGDKYVGQFHNGMMDGKGALLYSDGSKLEGVWSRNQRDGVFVFTPVSGAIQKQIWKSDIFKEIVPSTTNLVQQSIHINGNSSRNEIVDCNLISCHEQKGDYTFSDGTVYNGYFKNGKPDGYGRATYKNGKIYTGIWKNGMPEGEGTYTYASGKVVKGQWKQGKWTTSGTAVNTNETKVMSAHVIQQTSNETPITVYAVIAGVATYHQLPSLKYTDDDAYRFYAFLKSPEGGALPDDQIRLLVDESATRKQIMEGIKRVSESADNNDVLIVYLSGHGLDGAYVPFDFNGTDNLIDYESISGMLRKSNAKYKLLIADACHSGSVNPGQRSAVANTIHNYYQSLSASTGGIAFMVSSAQDEVSLEYGGIRQGIFSHFLVRGLKGEADVNKDKVVSINELFAFVSSKVKAYTAGKQTPQLFGDFDAQMPVAAVR